jgi:hypothetical protein
MPDLDINSPVPNLTVDQILSNPDFHDYLVGFMEAELGLHNGDNRASWAITQSNAPELMEAIRIY